MEQLPMKMDKAHMVSASGTAKGRVQHIIDLATAMQTDPRRKDRLAQQECIACFYGSRIGGSAMTNRPCGWCGAMQMYPSTNTDALCPECAQTHSLCKHCGGDIDMRAGRRKWPGTPVIITAPEEMTLDAGEQENNESVIEPPRWRVGDTIILRGTIFAGQDFQWSTFDFGEGVPFAVVGLLSETAKLEAPGYGQIGNYGNGRLFVQYDQLPPPQAGAPLTDSPEPVE
jgi:hypothetical protein